MYQSLSNPTEQSMHQFALLMSLLEEHDFDFITPQQAALFMPLFQTVLHRDLPYASRYNLESRADNFIEYFDVPVELAEKEQQIRDGYAEALKGRVLSNHLVDTTRSAATDEEMRADLEMQLSKLNGLPQDSKVFQAIPKELNEQMGRQRLEPEAFEVLQSEVSLAMSMPSSLEFMGDVSSQEMLQNPYQWLWSMSDHARTDAEIMVARANADSIQAVVPMTEQEMAAGLRGPSEDMLENVESGFYDEALDARMTDEQVQDARDEMQRNDDALAQTAGELLDKVADNQSTKFQKSSFLDLMRRLRDREARVEGEKIVEVC